MKKHIAIIPLRKGSKGIPGKNKKKLLGRPLFSWVLHEALQSNLDKIYLYTDDEDILKFAEKEYNHTKKLGLIKRDHSDATDTSSTEDAMKSFCEKIDHSYDTLTLLQATSPLTTCSDINLALKKLESNQCDSVISLVNEKRFIWDAKGNSLNYDFNNRPRRQDFDGLLIENGAIYSTTKTQFESSGIRIGGKIEHILMPADTFVEIDEPSDFLIIEELLKKRLQSQKGAGGSIKALVLDVDGVFTDGRVGYGSEGELFKIFNMRDGMGLEILRENSVLPIVITSEDSDLVKSRMSQLKITNAYFGVKDKYHQLFYILNKLNMQKSEVLYLGDDRNDLSNILSCGWGICPSDAMPEVYSNADIQLRSNGGHLAIREAVNFILKHNKRSN